jgi:hypothetical protein
LNRHHLKVTPLLDHVRSLDIGFARHEVCLKSNTFNAIDAVIDKALIRGIAGIAKQPFRLPLVRLESLMWWLVAPQTRLGMPLLRIAVRP